MFPSTRVASTSPTSKVLALLVLIAFGQGWMLVQKAKEPAAHTIGIGDVLPDLVLEQQGVSVPLPVSELPDCTHLIFFSPSCSASALTVARWNATRSLGDTHPVVGISYADWDETEEFASLHAIRFPLLATGSARMGEVASTAGTYSLPRILLLREGGRVAAIGDSRSSPATLAADAGCASGGVR